MGTTPSLSQLKLETILQVRLTRILMDYSVDELMATEISPTQNAYDLLENLVCYIYTELEGSEIPGGDFEIESYFPKIKSL